MQRWRRAYEAFGVGFRLETNRPEHLAPLLASLLPHRPVPDDDGCSTFCLDFDQQGAPETLSVDGIAPSIDFAPDAPLLWQFDSLVTLHVAEQSPHVFIHAGVVGYRGRGILLPGRSFAGKTTLTAALLSCGADYYSDDFAVVTGDGYVLPCHSLLRLRTPDGRVERSAADFGALAGQTPLKPAVVVDTEYRHDKVWEPVRLSPGECVLRLFANAAAARCAPQRVGTVLAQVARSAVCLSGPRGDAVFTARRILEYCDALFVESDHSTGTCSERPTDATLCPN